MLIKNLHSLINRRNSIILNYNYNRNPTGSSTIIQRESL